jgi:hypothetical protein
MLEFQNISEIYTVVTFFFFAINSVIVVFVGSIPTQTKPFLTCFGRLQK